MRMGYLEIGESIRYKLVVEFCSVCRLVIAFREMGMPEVIDFPNYIGCSKGIHNHYMPMKPWNRNILRELRPHTSSPPVAITLRKRCIQTRIAAANSSGAMELRISCTFSCDSSNDRPSQVCRRCFTVAKKYQSLGAISGEYGR
jgi:hypothetical protein